MLSLTLQSCHRFWRLYVKTFRNRPAEAGAFTFLVLASLIMYIHGAFYILPFVLVDQNHVVQTFAVIAATWCLLAVWAHLYLLHSRESSIAGRILHPVIVAGGDSTTNTRPVPDSSYDEADLRERLVTEQTKAIGQQFLNSPFGSDVAWHICGVCETYVPPRSWHCAECNTCILRRDHHCIFTMCCIGLNNQVHFLGLLIYLTIGCFYAWFLSMSYSYHYLETPYWMYFLKSFVSAYNILWIWNLNVVAVLSSVALLGGTCAGGVFFFYFYLALQGKTSSDNSRRIERVPAGQPKYSYQTLESFLGTNPILRIMWPFTSSRSQRDYTSSSNNEPRTVKSIAENLIQVI